MRTKGKLTLKVVAFCWHFTSLRYKFYIMQIKPPLVSYCEQVRNLPPDDPDRKHHDHVHGFAVKDDNELFGRLIMEINQAGLNWTLILKKEENFRRAFEGFDILKVAAYGEDDKSRLLADAGIIRNRRKVDAVIHNAGVIRGLQREYGSFSSWLDHHHPMGIDGWVRLFKKTFRFTGPEIVNEWLMSTGYLPGAHREDCPVYDKVIRSGPEWLKL